MKKIYILLLVLLCVTTTLRAQHTAENAANAVIEQRTQENPQIHKKDILGRLDDYMISCALKVPYVDTSAKIYDFAGLFSDNEAAKLKKACLALRDNYGVDAIVVTITNNPSYSTDDYCNDFYDYNDFGVGEQHDGLCVVIDMQNRNYRYYDTGRPATYSVAGGMVDTYNEIMTPALHSGRYFDGVYAVLSRYGADYEDNVYIQDVVIPNFIVILVAFVVATIIVLVVRSFHKMVKKATNAGFYAIKDTFVLTKKSDNYIRTDITRVYSPRDKGGSGGSSSSGSSHSGGGGSF